MGIIKINEIFKSIDGEGIRTGAPTIFIRFAGCNLHCKYCDTPYALKGDQYDPEYVDAQSVARKVESLCPPPKSEYGGMDSFINITITGGEPLIHYMDILEILESLGRLPYRFSINIETNGSINPDTFIYKYNNSEFGKSLIVRDGKVQHSNHIFFTFDIKTSSAGERERLACLDDNGDLKFAHYIPTICHEEAPTDVIKAVVGSIEDLDYVRGIYTKNMSHLRQFAWYISPVFGKIEPKDLVEYVLKYPACNSWKVQLQLHKIIWDKDKRGV